MGTFVTLFLVLPLSAVADHKGDFPFSANCTKFFPLQGGRGLRFLQADSYSIFQNIFPGFMIPLGSKAALIRFIKFICSSGKIIPMYSFCT